MIGIFSNLKEWDFNNEFLVESVAKYLSDHDEKVMVSVGPSVCIPVCELAMKTGITSKISIVSPFSYDSEKNRFEHEGLNKAYKAYFSQFGGSMETLSQFIFEGGSISLGHPVQTFYTIPRVLQISREEQAFKFDNCKISLCDPFDMIYKEDISKTIEFIEGDALSFEKWDTVVHCANLYHTFGAGIARQIAAKYPWADKADKTTIQGDLEKLGTFSIGVSPEKDKRIVNLYGQKGIGNNGHPLKRNVRYDHLYDGFYLLFERAAKENWKVAIPYKVASDLAGGDWNIVESIIKSAWQHNPVETYIVKWNG